jgi:hypothetical protein
MIVHRRRPTPWWWLLLVALAVLPWGWNGHWIVTGQVWLVIAAILAWRFKRRGRRTSPSIEQLHS